MPAKEKGNVEGAAVRAMLIPENTPAPLREKVRALEKPEPTATVPAPDMDMAAAEVPAAL